MWSFERIFKGARKHNASDIHLVHGVAPVLRIDGSIRPIDGEPLDEPTLTRLYEELATERHREIFQREWQLCFSRHWPGVGRFRVSVYYHAGCPEMSIRLCETVVRTAQDLTLPPIVEELTRLPHGLVLVTGPTGVGKTTTLNFMIDTINRERRAKIVTIEDPIEFVHENHRSIVVQQEVATDVRSFRAALIHVLRQDPDVIVIGEMRDLETIETALVAAETGHLVFATLHTPDSIQTLQRIYSVFPGERQNFVTVQLANSLQAIIFPEAAAARPRQRSAAGLRNCRLYPRGPQSHPRAAGASDLQRDANGPQTPNANHGQRTTGTVSTRRHHVRHRHLQCA